MERRPRVHARAAAAEVLPLLEEVLGGGVAPALARTAAQLREDLDALDELAAAPRTPGDVELRVDASRAAGGAAPARAAPLAARRGPCPTCRRCTWRPSTRC